ncbi:PucR family transcriptional regulator [Bacillus songklensis]|uniref:PucR family transcriptional regulator n=1 Tax=Bacillus songklensis TaxID=1069116 RepID=A0ABV8AY05_9BACI
MKSYLTVQEILKRKHFVTSEVAAGKEGLHKPVKWVHIVEVTQIKRLLKGNELILSTGVGWKENEQMFISFLEQLIECNAAGLCIEMGTYTSKIPSEVIAIADQHQFPIILFHQEVPFIEITQDVHSLLINQHYQMISDLENYSQQLQKMLLIIDHYHPILHFFYQYTDLQVIIKLNEENIQFVPEINPVKRKELLNLISRENNDQKVMTKQIIQVLTRNYAELFVVSPYGQLTEFDLLAVDRTATALAQHFLRDLYVEEKKRVDEAEWMTKWLIGELTESELTSYLEEANVKEQGCGAVVCVCRPNPQKRSVDFTYLKMFLKTLFEQHGFDLFVIERRGDFILILINKRSVHTWKQRIEEGFVRFLNTDYCKRQNFFVHLLGIGKLVTNVQEINRSYQTALETVKVQEKLESNTSIHFYDDLHMYRVLSLIQQPKDLREVMMEYLEPVIMYDQQYNGKLMETLKVYLECNGSKQETAKRLFVVRQTLYHRIEKLEKLLGTDFMEPKKRMAIEFMIMAYDYLFSKTDQISS